MDELITRCSTQRSDETVPGCGALGASTEISLVQLIRALQRKAGSDRQTLFDAAHAD